MATELSKRNYNMSDAELCMFTSNLCVTMTRDLTDLADFGITAPKIAALKALGDAFEILPTDEVLLAYVIAATEAKTVKSEAIKETIRDMITRCQVKWGADSWQEKSLGVKGMNKYTDDSLLVASNRVHAQMTTFLTELADTGLTQAMLDAMEDLNEEFEVAKNAQFTKVAEREDKAETRITKGNEIYALISTYCEIGKRVYAKSNPAKYNDYVIYTSTSPGSLTAPANFAFDAESLTFTWDAVTNATSYEFETSTDGTSYTQYWTGSETTCTLSEVPTTKLYFRVKARNAGGYGPYSLVIEYDFTLPLTAPTNLAYNSATKTFTWSAVATATSYDFQYRNTLQVPWTTLNAGNSTSLYHVDPSGNYVCRVRAKRNADLGPFSTELNYTVS